MKNREYFFTSDTHYYHRGIIGKAPNRRQFLVPGDSEDNISDASIRNMNETMIARHNAVVREGDVVYFLGDFSFGNYNKTKDILQRLNGDKILILGNHDNVSMNSRLVNSFEQPVYNGWTNMMHYFEYRFSSHFVVMCHFPFAVWNKSHHGSLNLHGHSHGTFPGSSQQQDVGVDCWDFYPVTMDQILDRMKTAVPYRNKDRHGN